ncbi:MAG: hypothetical protein GWP21_06250 [Euryarchaeota archaeon]|nr:hypothetical protein [Euryarchaeota archaeon]
MGDENNLFDNMQLTNLMIEQAVNHFLMEINAPDTDPRVYSRFLAFWQGNGRRILELRVASGETEISQLADFMFETHNRVARRNGRRTLRREGY